MNRSSVNKIPKPKVLKAALALFSSKGYAETKMTEIAQAVGISVGTLYLRFKNKEGLFLDLCKEQGPEFDSLTSNLPYHDPLKALKAYIALNLEFALKKRQLLSMFIREHRLPFLRPLRNNFLNSQQKVIHNILISGVKKGIFRKVDTRETAYMIFACIRGAILLKHVFGIGDPQTMSNSLFKLITNGIRKDLS